jgi:hypothetical protein
VASLGAVTPRGRRLTHPLVILGGVFFGVLLVLAVHFYKERALTLDGAYYMYRLVQDNQCFYGHGRIGACLTEILPLAVRGLGGSLRGIFVAFSVSHVLIYLIPFAVVALVLGDPVRAVAIPLLLAVGVRHVFYYVPSELLEGVALLVLVLAWLRGRTRLGAGRAAGALVAMSILIGCFHLALVAAVVFALGFDMLDRRRRRDPWAWLVLVGVVAFTAWTVHGVAPGSYEGSYLFGRRPPLAQIFTISTLRSFLPRYVEVNGLAEIVAAAVVIAYLARFALRADGLALAKALWVLACFLGYSATLLYEFSPPVRPAAAHYLEHISMPLVVIAVVPLAWDVIPRLGRTAGAALVAALLGFGTVGMVRAHVTWTAALAYADRVMDALEYYPERKFVTQVPVYSAWVFGVQTLLLSSLTRPEPMTVLHALDPKLIARLTTTDDLFHETNLETLSLPQDDLDPAYFPLRRTPYRAIPPSELPAPVVPDAPGAP